MIQVSYPTVRFIPGNMSIFLDGELSIVMLDYQRLYIYIYIYPMFRRERFGAMGVHIAKYIVSQLELRIEFSDSMVVYIWGKDQLSSTVVYFLSL